MSKRIPVANDGSPTAHDAGFHVLRVVDDIAIGQRFDSAAQVLPDYVECLLAGLRSTRRKILARAENTASTHGQHVPPLLVWRTCAA